MIQIKMHGLGGQGVVTAAKILVEAVVIHEQRFARSLPAYGHERRGAPIYADVMVADEAILLNTFVYHPDIVLLFDPSVIDKGVDICAGMHAGTQLVLNCHPGDPAPAEHTLPWKHIIRVNAKQIALDLLQRNIPNSAMLGALARTGVVGILPVLHAIEKIFGSKAGDLNVQAAREAYDTAQIV
jgi:pyruvate ferredoxin oxidoreductase gamma subunit